MSEVKVIQFEVSDRAMAKVMELVRLEHAPQWVSATVDARVPCEGWEQEDKPPSGTPENPMDLALIDVTDKGLVIGSDPDPVETDEYGGGMHAFRPMFIPWAHVYGLTAYRAT